MHIKRGKTLQDPTPRGCHLRGVAEQHGLVLACARRLNLDHLGRLNFDQGSRAVREAGGC